MADDTKTTIFDQYPATWEEYVGQDRAKRELKMMAASAAKTGRQMRHILISSPTPGVGKTALALLTVRQLGRPVYMAGGKMSIEQVQMMFSRCKDGDVIFYDEIHKAADGGGRNAEWMLQVLEQGVLVTPGGEYKIPTVTFVGATTHKGLLPPAVLERFKVIDLEDYTNEQGALIAQTLGTKIMAGAGLPNVHTSTAAAISRAASNRPRIMRNVLESLRDLAICDEIIPSVDGEYDITEALAFSDLTEDGLTKEAQAYLRVLYSEMQMMPAGAAVMRERLGLVGHSLQQVEALLKDKAYIRLTKGGRALTGEGLSRAAQLCGTTHGSVLLG